MSMSFPLPLGEFFEGLKILSARPDLPAASQVSRSAGGDVMRASVGARLWTMQVDIVTQYHRDAEDVRARLHLLREPGASLLVHAMPCFTPRADEAGTGLGGYSPVIGSIASNNRDLTLSGLPPGYVLSRGDYLSFTYGSGPVRYAFHHIVTGGVASGTGAATVEVSPFIRAGAAPGDPVRLIKPQFKAVLVDSDGGAARPLFFDGISLTLQQTLR